MTGVKHTPGPWRWSNAYDATNGEKTWSLLGNGDYGILSCDGVSNSPQCLGRTGISDADLIAAAPDMLKDLKDALAAFEQIGEDKMLKLLGDGFGICCLMSDMKKTIAKAGAA